MRCFACSAENPDANSFCESCGARLGTACLQCGYGNSPTARFCGSCGSALGTTEAELKYATVVSADIVGSTALITGLEPEQARERLQPMVAAMCAVVKRFDGTVVRTLGDGIMAFFGAPRAQEGHALLACEAALAMHAELPSPKEGPAIRIGLHSGRLVSSVPGRILLRFRRLTGSQFTSPAACKEKPSQAELALPTTAPASCSPIAMCDPSGRES
jgi:hypothetical protein